MQLLNEFKKDRTSGRCSSNILSMEGPLDSRPAFQRKYMTLDPAKPKAEQTRES